MLEPELKDIVARFGRNRKAGNAKAKKLLNRPPLNHEEAILAAAESLVRFGFEDLSHFSFAFKKLFGHSPTSLSDKKE
jgi:AraC-like DNA-binding protein